MLRPVIKDDLTPEFVRKGLDTRFIGRDIRYFPSLSSTMDAAREAVLAGAGNGTVILAGEQTAARGRLKRRWFSPQSCLAFSVVLYPAVCYLPGLVMAAALAAAEAVTAFAAVAAEIKWPNDILLHGRKISGLLIEAGQRSDGQSYAVVGVGLNVNLDLAACHEIGAMATSLFVETGRELSRAAVLREFLTGFERLYEVLIEDGPVFEAWRARLVTLGKAVQVFAGDTLYEGIAEDVASDGALLLRRGDGCLVKLPAGDVSLKIPSADSSKDQ